MRLLPDTLIALGAIAVPVGVGLMHFAAGVVVGGVELLAIGVAIAARGQHGRTS